MKNVILLTIISLEALVIMFLVFVVFIPKENIKCNDFTEFEYLHNAVFGNLTKFEELRSQGLMSGYTITGEGLPSGDILCQTRGQLIIYANPGKLVETQNAVHSFMNRNALGLSSDIKIYFIENSLDPNTK